MTASVNIFYEAAVVTASVNKDWPPQLMLGIYWGGFFPCPPLRLFKRSLFISFCSKWLFIFYIKFLWLIASMHATYLVFASTTIQNFYMEDQSFKSRSQQNEHVFIYNIISKRMLPYNISIFKFQLKLLLKKFPQQCTGYHLVIIRWLRSGQGIPWHVDTWITVWYGPLIPREIKWLGPRFWPKTKTKLAQAGLFTPYPGPAHTLLPCVVDLDQVGMQQFGPFSLQGCSRERAC